jgi:hypothetical protein
MKLEMNEKSGIKINSNFHEIRPEYIKKLQKIEKNGKFQPFKTVDDLRKTIEVFSPSHF